MKHAELTDKIIASFWVVYKALGYGFLESVYEKAMVIELEKLGLHVQSQHPIRVYYAGQIVGEFWADLLVEGLVIVELKAVSALAIQHEAQLLNYLNATDCEVGLLFNFGPKPQIKRKVYDNERKVYVAHGPTAQRARIRRSEDQRSDANEIFDLCQSVWSVSKLRSEPIRRWTRDTG